MKYKLIIFDLDGTILDTLDDLTDSVNFALKKNGLPVRSRDEIRSFVGNGIRLLIERSVPAGCSTDITDTVFSDFRNHYKTNSCNKTCPYDGITALLEKLRNIGISLAVVSNKADFAVKDIVLRYFDGLLDYSAGEKEGIPRKPAPDSVCSAISYFGADIKDVLYIGDSEVDIETSLNAGTDCVCVSWGFRDRELLCEKGAKLIFDSADELENYLLS